MKPSQPNHIYPYLGYLAHPLAARYATMLTPKAAQRQQRKYDDHPGQLTQPLIMAHLAGQVTLAAPAVQAGTAYILSLDIDAGGQPAIRAALNEAISRGWFAFAEYTPRPDWGDDQQRGYIHIIPAPGETVSAERLQLLGQTIAAVLARPGWNIDPRCTKADTRLPLGRHTHTNQFAEVWLADGTIFPATTPRLVILEQLAQCWYRGPVDDLPTPPERPIPSPRLKPTQITGSLTVDELRAHYNSYPGLTAVLEAHDGRQHSSSLWHCPCGNHTHGDANPSLMMRASKKPQIYGDSIVQGWSPSCRFHSEPHIVWDAFNVEMELSGRSFKEMLAHVRQVLDIPLRPTRPQPNDAPAQSTASTPEASRPAQKPPEAPYRPHPTPEPTIPAPRAATNIPAASGNVVIPSTQLHHALQLRAALDTSLSPAERRVLAELLTHAQERTWCRLSVPRLAEQTTYHRRTIQIALRKLESKGYLTTDRSDSQHGTETNIYHFGDQGGRSDRSPELKINHETHDHALGHGRGGLPALAPVDFQDAPKTCSEPVCDIPTGTETRVSVPPAADPGEICISPRNGAVGFETVGDPDGAQYNPAWASEPVGPPTYRRRRDREDPEVWARVNQTMRVLPPAEVPPAPAQLVLDASAADENGARPAASRPTPASKPLQLPRWADEASKRRYYGLLAKAKKSTSFGQRQALQRQAVEFARQVIERGLLATPVEALIADSPPLETPLELAAPEPQAREVLTPAHGSTIPTIWRIAEALRQAEATSGQREPARLTTSRETAPPSMPPPAGGYRQTDEAWVQLQETQARYWEGRGDAQRAAFIRQAAGLVGSG